MTNMNLSSMNWNLGIVIAVSKKVKVEMLRSLTYQNQYKLQQKNMKTSNKYNTLTISISMFTTLIEELNSGKSQITARIQGPPFLLRQAPFNLIFSFLQAITTPFFSHTFPALCQGINSLTFSHCKPSSLIHCHPHHILNHFTNTLPKHQPLSLTSHSTILCGAVHSIPQRVTLLSVETVVIIAKEATIKVNVTRNWRETTR